jgi:hypothetical protein
MSVPVEMRRRLADISPFIDYREIKGASHDDRPSARSGRVAGREDIRRYAEQGVAGEEVEEKVGHPHCFEKQNG